MKLFAHLAATSVLFAASSATAAPDVVVSIKPIHSLVAAIMEGIATPDLIVESAASPHTFTMKPSNARNVQDADLIFWTGPSMEAFLKKPLDALASDATIVRLDSLEGLVKLPLREGGPFETHDHGSHDHEPESADGHEDDHHAEDQHHHDHQTGGIDTHLWLNPENAKVMATAIETSLAALDPDNAAAYHANLAKLTDKIDELDVEIAATLSPVKNKPFIVFHDAYQYFEEHYGVTVAGSITVSPEVMAGAERIAQIQAKVKELQATCVFSEPQFEPKLVEVVIEGTSARSATLDPLGASLAQGPELYFELMRSIATSLSDCLDDVG